MRACSTGVFGSCLLLCAPTIGAVRGGGAKNCAPPLESEHERQAAEKPDFGADLSMCGLKPNRRTSGDQRRLGGDACGCTSYLTLQTDSLCCGQNFRDANEIVGGGCQHKEPLHQVTTAMACLAQAADGLHPAERLFDPVALDRADAIAVMAGGARIDRRTAVGVVLRDMRGAAAFAAAGDEVSGVV